MKKYGKLLITILLAFGVSALVIMVKNNFSNHLPNTDMGVVSVISRGRTSVLFMGSSAYRKGIDMYLVDGAIPGEAFMLTYNGNQPFNMAIELEEIIKGGAQIDTLVADFNPSMVDRGADLSDKRLLWDISMEGKNKLWEELKKEANLFTWYDFWVSSNMDYAFTYPVAKRMISQRYYLGGSASLDNTEGLTEDELLALPIKEEKGIHDLQMSSIDSIIDLCRDNNINLIFLECPRFYTMEDNENYKEKSDELKEHIKDKGIDVIRAADLDFDNTNPEYYSDLTHMSKKGSEVLTKMIIENVLGKK